MPRRQQHDAVLWKDEGPGGPVYVRRDGKVENYEDSDHVFLGRKMAKWFSREDAAAIAQKLDLPFEER